MSHDWLHDDDFRVPCRTQWERRLDRTAQMADIACSLSIVALAVAALSFVGWVVLR